jgi:hypothetical protein
VATQGAGYYPSGFADDVGLYYWVPKLGSLLGISNWGDALKWFFVLLAIAAVVVYPLIFDRLFDSLLVGIVAPVLLLLTFDFTLNTDTYWISAWTLALGLPLLLLAARTWPSRRWRPSALMLTAMVLASFSNTIRANAGLGLLVAAFVLVMIRQPAWRQRATCAVVLLIAYGSVSHGVMSWVLSSRASNMRGVPIASSNAATIGAKDFSAHIPQHPLWHSLYLGLGFNRNRYGIRYMDAVAIDFVKRKDPSALFTSKRYEHVLRQRYFEIVRRDPGFVAQGLLDKSEVTLNDGLQQAPLAVLAIPFMLAVGRRRRLVAVWLALIAAAAVVAFISPVLVIPFQEYELGWLAAFTLLGILVVTWVAAPLGGLLGPLVPERLRGTLAPGSAVQERLRARIPPRRRAAPAPASASGDGDHDPRIARDGSRRARLVLISVLALGTLMLALDRYGEPAGQGQANSAAPYSAQLPPKVAGWSMTGALPSGWQALPGVSTKPDAAGTVLLVTTTTGRFEYQLVSPKLRLGVGSYVAVARGRILAGGFELGVLDVERNQWVAVANFLRQESGNGLITMKFPFTLGAAKQVRMILSNYAPSGPKRSRWMVIDASIRSGEVVQPTGRSGSGRKPAASARTASSRST